MGYGASDFFCFDLQRPNNCSKNCSSPLGGLSGQGMPPDLFRKEVVNQDDGLKLSSAWLPALGLIKPHGSCLESCEQEEVGN